MVLDSWTGLGAIVVGMLRHGYEFSLTSDENGWRATFLHRSTSITRGSGRSSGGRRRLGAPYSAAVFTARAAGNRGLGRSMPAVLAVRGLRSEERRVGLGGCI